MMEENIDKSDSHLNVNDKDHVNDKDRVNDKDNIDLDKLEEQKLLTKCSLDIINVIEDKPTNIAMGSLACLLTTYAQTNGETIESFFGRLVQLWMVIKEISETVEKLKSGINGDI